MASRRTHMKSKLGCYSCKKRHIKCDRQGPPCANCQVRGSECTPSAPEDTSRAAESVAPATAPIAAPPSNRERLLEIELIHRWSVQTFSDFSLVADDHEFWQTTALQDALSHDYLLEAILAISSLHVAITTTPERSTVYYTAALEYQDRAIASFKTKAILVGSGNHQALFAFSIIVLALAFAVPRHSPQGQSNRSVLAHLQTIFSLLQGTTSIFRSSRVWIQHSPFAVIPGRYQHRDRSTCHLEEATREAFQQLRAQSDAEYVSRCSEAPGLVSEIVIWHETNLKAIDWLQECFRCDRDEGTLRCLTWLATLEPEFMRSIEQAEPLALLVTMYWAVLLHHCGENRWWARSSGKILVTELCAALASRKTAWASHIAWVCRQVGLPVLL